MIDKAELYRRTNNGLDIILYYYPHLREYAGTKKSFKLRDEDDASASFFIPNRGDNAGIYHITDFGADNRAQDPLAIAQREEGLRFYDVLHLWATRVGLAAESDKPLYQPEWEYRTATPEEKEGDIILEESDQDFTIEDCATFGTKVNKEQLMQMLNWVKVKSITFIKNGKASIKKPTALYPIYARRSYYIAEGKLEKFYKTYEPLSDSKQFRFSYAPRGGKQDRYINGLYELKQAYKKHNDSQSADKEGEHKMEKFSEAIICSGERDAACIRARGYFPIWFNSETFDINGEELAEIYRYVDNVYNIPDIDETGKRRGLELSRKFWSIYTIWLPEHLKLRKDWRGNSFKDLRDWCELNPKQKQFNDLLNTADCVQFWKEIPKKDRMEVSFDDSSLKYFYETYGFGNLKDDVSKTTQFVHVQGNIVKPHTPNEAYNFMYNKAQERSLPRRIRSLVISSNKVNQNLINLIKPMELDFGKFTKTSQLFFFKNNTIEVTQAGITKTKKEAYIWEDKVIPHDFKPVEEMFKITEQRDDYGEYTWDIEIKENSSCYFKYCVNTSRMFWREELEERLQGKSKEEVEAYRAAHKFDIAGPNLTPEEIAHQKQNLISKIFTIGYLLHGYKADSMAWAPFLMDGKVGADGECNGRSGKSFFLKALTTLINTKRIDGRNDDKFEFVFDGVDKYTEFVYFDDASEKFPLKRFYSLITSDFLVNPKGEKPYCINYEQAPKMGFTTNYIPNDFDSSTLARLLFVVFSDYYHEKTATNGYRQTRSIRHDFGKDLMRDYTPEEWNADLNFMLQCLQFYLRVINQLGAKIQPPMDNIFKRKSKLDMGGEEFESWAFGFFSEDSGNLDTTLSSTRCLGDFRRAVGNTIDMKPKRFMNALRAFVDYCPYTHEVNPKDICGANGRLQLSYVEEGIRQNVSGIHIRSVKRHKEMEMTKESNDYEF